MRRTVLVALAIVCTFPSPPASAGGGCRSAAIPDAQSTHVRLVAGCFSPVVARVDLRQVVTFENLDSYEHRIDAPGGWGAEQELAGGDAVAFRFDEAGVFPYACFLHPTMTGVVVVDDGVREKGAGLGISSVAPRLEQSSREAPLSKGAPNDVSAAAPAEDPPSIRRPVLEDPPASRRPVLAGAGVLTLGLAGAAALRLRRRLR